MQGYLTTAAFFAARILDGPLPPDFTGDGDQSAVLGSAARDRLLRAFGKHDYAMPGACHAHARARTHACMHARMHARTHAHSHSLCASL
ncbi:hypothetical protein EON67_10320 [archaeon]|nr:MAG: hypothetical protein EON67_10320 [archaeon]